MQVIMQSVREVVWDRAGICSLDPAVLDPAVASDIGSSSSCSIHTIIANVNSQILFSGHQWD